VQKVEKKQKDSPQQPNTTHHKMAGLSQEDQARMWQLISAMNAAPPQAPRRRLLLPAAAAAPAAAPARAIKMDPDQYMQLLLALAPTMPTEGYVVPAPVAPAAAAPKSKKRKQPDTDQDQAQDQAQDTKPKAKRPKDQDFEPWVQETDQDKLALGRGKKAWKSRTPGVGVGPVLLTKKAMAEHVATHWATMEAHRCRCPEQCTDDKPVRGCKCVCHTY
jgi:hypothetical protein